jgi:phosphoserine phosphatase RsbU/P
MICHARSAKFILHRKDRLAAGLERLDAGDIDVVLLDPSLPESKGLDTLRAVQKKAPGLPIVVLSGLRDEEMALEAVQRGAQDNLFKEYLDTGVIERALRYAIERAARESAEDALQVSEAEMRVIGEIHKRLLPHRSPQLPGFDVAGVCVPAAGAGGDYFDYLRMHNGATGVVLADVSSHGIAPAMIMASTRRLLRTLAQDHSDIGHILTRANRAIAEDTEPGQFVTLFIAEIDPTTKTLIYAGAGHEAYVLEPSGTTITLESTSLPLGAVEDSAVPARGPIPLQPGQLLVLLSDGFEEAQSPDGNLFGIKRVLETIQSLREHSAAEIVAGVVQEVATFCKRERPNDDVTAVVIKVLEG